MRVVERLDHTHLRAAVVGFRDALRAHQARLNRLNVYPVPDGDTGTNMALTLESVVTALDEVPVADRDMVATCRAISHGSLMGARGNSGVILSQVLRGLCHRLDDADLADAASLAAALAEASTAAYAAVMRPVEGTILTVVREASEAAVAAASEVGGAGEQSLVDVLDAAAGAARDALARTPELLPVLKEAGVVDAGGAGFVLFLDALLQVVDGRPVPDAPEGEAEPTIAVGHPAEEGGMDGPRYEVMYLLDAPDEKIDAFKAAWMDIGESIVVVGGDGLWNCHIHADDIGASIEAGIEAGRPRQIRVTDLAGQVEEERWVRQGLGSAPGADPAEPRPRVTTAVVAVALGDDVRDGFRSMGVQEVVVGGQTMNPSTADLLEAIEATDADEVIVLPNNKNIVPVAAQAAALAGKPVLVVPTRGMVTGLAAMMVYDADAPAEANAKAMEEAASQVVSGQVTWAVRDSGSINEGDWLGLADDEIVVVHPDLATCATCLLDRLVEGGHELVTVFVGASTPDETTGVVGEWLAENRPNANVEVQRWRLPLSAYLFSIE
ncbi:MAG: fatty acid kinase [Actinomycetota bacterium]|jgi:DAK2 domain fusion protein YloV|nr:fatty acid kinase [Actinomycetota bacterium]